MINFKFISELRKRVLFLKNYLGKYPIFYFCVSFVLGIYLASFFEKLDWAFYLLVLCSLLVAFVLLKPLHKSACFLLFLFLCFLVGFWRYQLEDISDKGNHISLYNNQEVEFIGTILREVDRRSSFSNIVVSAESVNAGRVQGDVLIKVPKFPEYQYGDKLKVEGFLQEPAVFEEFSYKDYLRTQGIYSVMYNAKITKISEGGGNFLYRQIYALKDETQSVINSILPEPHSSLLAGILIGVKRSMPEEFSEALSRTGTTHIIAVSGYNVTILIITLNKALQKFGRRWAMLIISLSLFVFAVLTGASPPVLRSVIMGYITLTALVLGRRSLVPIALMLSAVVLLILDPYGLWSISFQLSFVSTLGLITLNSPLIKVVGTLSEWPLVEDLCSTLSAIIFTLPITLYNFGTISIVAPLVNLFILWVIPLSMLIGFVALCLGFVSLSLGRIIAWFVWLPLTYMIEIIEVFSKFDFAAVEVGRVGFLFPLLLYLILFLLVVEYYYHADREGAKEELRTV